MARGAFIGMGNNHDNIDKEPPEFGRRLNRETGKYESLCMRCLETVGNADRLEELEPIEKGHKCTRGDVPGQVQ